VIPEGEDPQLFGWLIPNPSKFSNSRTLLSWLQPNKKYALNTNMNGEERAFVVTGEYEKVFPFDIYPVQLLKAILVEDIEKMEQLGIYEVAEEDFALCEVVCTSKIPVQETVRKGLDLIRKELS
jgi:Na+-transporting NADH:ubiquinone oxidoreductase subunit A